MDGAQLLIAHAVKAAILAILVGLVVTRRYRLCWSLTAYLVVVFATNSMTSFWPERFYNYHFFTAKQAVYDVFKLLIALELSHKVFAAFPGALSRWRAMSFAVLIATTCAVLFAEEGDRVTHVAYQWQPRIVAGSIWILCSIALLVAWHRLPIDGWHFAILAGYVPYLVVFTAILNLIPRQWSSFSAFRSADNVAYLMLMLFWAHGAWRREARPARIAERARPGLREQAA